MTGAVFNAAFMEAIGGYPKGVLIASRCGYWTWVSIADRNMTDPDSPSAVGWILADGGHHGG